ncbi:MAG: hypothetical protein ABIJ16_11550 [Bacteroidota bacterium]
MIFISILILISLAAQSQGFLKKNDKAETDTAKIREKLTDVQIVVVPYNPELYINYEELYLTKENGKSSGEINRYFRRELDTKLLVAFKKYCNVSSLLQSYTNDDNDDIYRIYMKSAYSYEDAAFIPKDFIPLSKDQSELSDMQPKKKEQQEGDLVDVVRDNNRKFLHVRFSEKDYIYKMSQNYNCKYFLFINQFDLKGDYSNPYAVNSMTYQRRIKVHFSLYTSSGEFVTGSFAYYDFPAKENDLDTIVESYFPLIASDIVSKIASGL